jgi:hypothetical protein
MAFLKNIIVLLLMLGASAPTYAVIFDIDKSSCVISNDKKTADEEKKEGEGEEEEPDCE